MNAQPNIDLIRTDALDPRHHVERCPVCFHLPIPEFCEDGSVYLRCLGPNHDHIAKGKNYDQASEHWNIYIAFYRKNFIGKP